MNVYWQLCIAGFMIISSIAKLLSFSVFKVYHLLNRRYLIKSTGGGPGRSEFSTHIFVTGLHWLEGLRSQKFLKSVQPFRRYGHFWILALKWGQNWCDWKKSPFFGKISCPFRKIIRHVKTTLWIKFWRFWAPTGCAIKYRRQK